MLLSSADDDDDGSGAARTVFMVPRSSIRGHSFSYSAAIAGYVATTSTEKAARSSFRTKTRFINDSPTAETYPSMKFATVKFRRVVEVEGRTYI